MQSQSKTETYMLGMQAVNSFFAMLYQAMKEAMPNADISKNGAYVWRGYQINNYEDLAPGQYFCQVYPGNPRKIIRGDGSLNSFTSRELVFQEAYEDDQHKPVDDMEELFSMKTGNYYYPFQVSLDLYRSRFFYMDIKEQYTMLKTFVAYGCKQALLWQRSQARIKLTGQDHLKGKSTPKRPAHRGEFEQVPIEFLNVWTQQATLFNTLKTVLDEQTSKILQKEVEWIKENASPANFDFRGLRLKLKSGGNEDSSDYLWAIHYEKPEILGCYTMPDKEDLYTYNLQTQNYFDLSESQQRLELADFVKKSLKAYYVHANP